MNVQSTSGRLLERSFMKNVQLQVKGKEKMAFTCWSRVLHKCEESIKQVVRGSKLGGYFKNGGQRRRLSVGIIPIPVSKREATE